MEYELIEFNEDTNEAVIEDEDGNQINVYFVIDRDGVVMKNWDTDAVVGQAILESDTSNGQVYTFEFGDEAIHFTV